MNQQFLEELKTIVDIAQIRENEPMKQHITFRVGGPADLLVIPDAASLPAILQL